MPRMDSRTVWYKFCPCGAKREDDVNRHYVTGDRGGTYKCLIEAVTVLVKCSVMGSF